MTGSDITNRVCDRRDCPALAQRAYLIHGQDFYLCAHHSDELEHTSPPGTPIARVTVSRVAPVVVVSDLPDVSYATVPPPAAAER